ncbi:MAG TPA: M23 family metallopeptidase [Polyangiaceae bacterium]
MSPLVRAGIAAAVLAALAAAVDRRLEPVLVTSGGATPGSAPAGSLLRPCPPGTLLDNSVCIPVPTAASSSDAGASVRNWQIHDRLPRRPDRPSDLRRYRWPVSSIAAFDPSPFTAAGAVELDALLLAVPPKTPITLPALDHQRGKTAVLYTGPAVGQTIVTEHRVLEGKQEQIYIVLHGNLGSIGTKAGTQLEPGAQLGTVGDSAQRGLSGLHFEVRRVRQGVDVRALRPDEYRSRAHTIACDPRNVLTLQAKR